MSAGSEIFPVKPSQLKAALLAAHAAGLNVMIHGPAGIGKTDIVGQTAQEMGGTLHDLYLATAEPSDVRGFPMPNRERGTMEWLPPETLPREGKGIIFGDEFGTAVPAVQAAMLTLVHGRRSGSYTVPDGFQFVLATNRATDRNVQHKLIGPMANRLVHLHLEPDLEDWCKWALGAQVATPVIGFLRFRPGLLHQFEAKATEAAFPSPRTWVMVSQLIKTPGTADLLPPMVTGLVGQGPGTEFLGFLRIYKGLPSPDSILLNPDSAPVPDDPATLYALAGALARKATEGNLGRLIRYLERLPVEFNVVSIKDAVGRKPALQNTRDFIEWCSAHQDVML